MPHPIDIHVGRRLRARRRMLCLTQEKLADSVDIRFQQIQKYERGQNAISLNVAKKWGTFWFSPSFRKKHRENQNSFCNKT